MKARFTAVNSGLGRKTVRGTIHARWRLCNFKSREYAKASGGMAGNGSRAGIRVPENRRLEPTSFVGSSQGAGFQFWGANASHEKAGFQFVNAPLGFSFHAQTCSV